MAEEPSLLYYLHIAERGSLKNGFMTFPRVLAQKETQTLLSRI